MPILQCALCNKNPIELRKAGMDPYPRSVVSLPPSTTKQVATPEIPEEGAFEPKPEGEKEIAEATILREESLRPAEDLGDDGDMGDTPPEDVERDMQETPAAPVPTPKPIRASTPSSNGTTSRAPIVHLATGHEESPDISPPVTESVAAPHPSRRTIRKKRAATSPPPPISTAKRHRPKRRKSAISNKNSPKRRTRGETILRKLGMLKKRLENMSGMSPGQISSITPEERKEIVQQISFLLWVLQKLGIKFSPE